MWSHVLFHMWNAFVVFFFSVRGSFALRPLAWETCLLLKPNLPWVLPANPKHWTIKCMHNHVYCRWCAHRFLNVKELDNIFVRYFGSYSNFTIFIALLKCSDTNECECVQYWSLRLNEMHQLLCWREQMYSVAGWWSFMHTIVFLLRC